MNIMNSFLSVISLRRELQFYDGNRRLHWANGAEQHTAVPWDQDATSSPKPPGDLNASDSVNQPESAGATALPGRNQQVMVLLIASRTLICLRLTHRGTYCPVVMESMGQ